MAKEKCYKQTTNPKSREQKIKSLIIKLTSVENKIEPLLKQKNDYLKEIDKLQNEEYLLIVKESGFTSPLQLREGLEMASLLCENGFTKKEILELIGGNNNESNTD